MSDSTRVGLRFIYFAMFVFVADLAHHYLTGLPLTKAVLYVAGAAAFVGAVFIDAKTVNTAITSAGSVWDTIRGRAGVVQATAPVGTTAVVTRPGEPDVVLAPGQQPAEVRESDRPADAPEKVARRRGGTAKRRGAAPPLARGFLDASPVDVPHPPVAGSRALVEGDEG